jgi:uncharacterized protein (TIGR03067 family)
MIRSTLIAAFLFSAAGLGIADDKKDAPKDVAKELKPFQGKWKVVKAVMKDQELPIGPLEMHFTFTGTKAEVSTKDGKQPGGEVTVNDKKDPAEIDLKGSDNTNTTSFGIYSFAKDGKLTLFFVKNGTRPTSFESAKFPDAILVVLEKVKE